MNEPISWDPSLVKKFSTSNHYKLLNQLRNEVKKYPLNNKKKNSSIKSNNTNLDNKNISNVSITQKSSSSNSSNIIKEAITNKSTVSFNNAKDFSIYNQTPNNNNRSNEKSLSVDPKTNEGTSSPQFKDRLNKIEIN